MNETKPVVIFDGKCVYCCGMVNFIIKRDTKKKFLFAHNKSEAAKNLLAQFDEEILVGDYFVVIENKKYFIKTSASLRIFPKLRRLWFLTYFFYVVPVFICDFFYNFISNNRYRWFGERESCMIPTEQVKERFLE